MDKINFANATLQKQAYITIDGKDYNVVDSTYIGGTDLDADTFNQLQANIENAINKNFNEILNLAYPIGRGFIDFTNTNYSNYLGFKWERELVGMTPVGLNTSDTDFDTIGKTGGEKTHKLTIDEMPSHSHKIKVSGSTIGGYSGVLRNNASDGPASNFIDSEGGNKSHNNMSPYKVVAFWKRIA